MSDCVSALRFVGADTEIMPKGLVQGQLLGLDFSVH